MTKDFYRFFYTKKSGSHAIINWLADALGGNVAFYNNRRFRKCYLPTDTVSSGISISGTSKELYAPKNDVHFNLATHAGPVFESFETQLLKPEWVPSRADCGVNRPGWDIVILRDVYNYLASEMIRNTRPALSDFPEYAKTKNVARWRGYADVFYAKNYIEQAKTHVLLDSWIHHAEVVLGERDVLERPMLVILFNRWFTEEAYRKEICETLDIPYSDRLLNSVARVNAKAGSWDDPRVYDGQATKMSVLYRWEFFAANPLYWEMLEKFPETEILNQRIFGQTVPNRGQFPFGEAARRFRDESRQ